MLEGFATAELQIGPTRLFVRWHGSGPPLLLLHGFPETHLMWRHVAPLLAERFTVVCADLPGYGRSDCPPSAPDHLPHAKRTMASQLLAAMEQLGWDRFFVAGHDRGGRVAYRMALDHPRRVQRLAVLDIVPTETVWERADARLALAFWPWSLLAQPEPLPERVLVAAGEVIIDDALGGWGSPAGTFPPEVRESYLRVLRDPEHAHAICEEYRAAATVDRQHDQDDRANGRRIVCPLLALWSATGPVGIWYEEGPLAVWGRWADRVQGQALEAGHFFPEERPDETAELLGRFFSPTNEPGSAGLVRGGGKR
jgi:haloacetate dehalogenase